MRKNSIAFVALLIVWATLFLFNACKKDGTGSSTNNHIPVLTTKPCVVNGSSVSSGGDISSDGGDTIIKKGICWSTSPDPTTFDDKTEDGFGKSSFTSVAKNFEPNTTYYIRAYAENSYEVGYGNQITVTTPQGTLPTLTTIPASRISNKFMQGGITLINDGGAKITDWGICYSKNPNPVFGTDKYTRHFVNGLLPTSHIDSIGVLEQIQNTMYVGMHQITKVLHTAIKYPSPQQQRLYQLSLLLQ